MAERMKGTARPESFAITGSVPRERCSYNIAMDIGSTMEKVSASEKKKLQGFPHVFYI
jgi:hypothetical protein